MLYRVRLGEELDGHVFDRALRTHTDTADVIAQLVAEGLDANFNQRLDHRRLDTLRIQTRTLVAIGWHDEYVAEHLNVSQRYVQGVRRDMGLIPPERTSVSPAHFTQPRKAAS